MNIEMCNECVGFVCCCLKNLLNNIKNSSAG